jgi:imidazolonepropionase-like amidohydrolase
VIALFLMAAAFADCTVIANGTAHLPDRVLQDSIVVLDGPTIAYAGGATADVSLSVGKATYKGRPCTLIEARGKDVTAGLVESSTQVGVVEISLEKATTNDDPGGADAVRAALRVSDAYDPRSVVVPVTRAGGITSVVVTPTGGLVSGQAAWVDLRGVLQSEAVARPTVAMVASLGTSGSKAQALMRLRELLDRARLYGRNGATWTSDLVEVDTTSLLDLAAMGAVVRGEIPLVVAVDRASDIEAVVRLAEEQRIRVVIHGGAEAWLVAGMLAKARVPVVIDPLVYGEGSFDQRYGREDNGALLAKAGVPVVIATGQTHNARTLRQSAGNAVRGGMDREDALRAITRGPALAFGMTDRGALVGGGMADVVVWSGDPLELSTRAEQVWIHGEAQSLRTRQTELLEKYRTL